jgi:predicted SprT family Zn-dependent metalloprotease
MDITADESRVATRLREVWSEACMRYVIDDNEFATFNIVLLENATINRITKKHNAALAQLHGADINVIVNRLAIAQNVEDFLAETVPHEIAHLVCFVRPHLGSGHNEGWVRVCRALGGRADVKFKNEYDLRQRKRVRYVYATPGAGRFEVSDVRHARIQEGTTYLTRANERVKPEHWTGDIT